MNQPDPDPQPVAFARGSVLENWTDNFIMPGYAAFKSELEALKAAADTFTANPDMTNLEALRAAWLSAYTTWQRISMFEIGPAESIGFRLQINTYPTDADLLESYVTNGGYDLKLPSNRDVKGFPALDYLLHGLAASEDAILARYAQDANKDAYHTYLSDVLDDMIEVATQVENDWISGYRDTFVQNDGSSATASLDRMINDYIFYYEKFLRAGKMGIPLGVFTGSVAPQTLEAYYRPEVGKDLFLEGLAAVKDLFNGASFAGSGSGPSLASYLQSLNALKDGSRLDILINDQLDIARDQVAALGTFRDEIENNNPPTAMLVAYDEVQRVVPLFKVDMVSAMSISIDFVDADGD